MVNASNKDLILFDFCETLVDFQTADAFVDFVRDNVDSPRMKFWEQILNLLLKLKIIAICYKLFPRKSIEKRIKLFQLKGLDELVLKEMAGLYYSNVIKQRFIPETIELLQDFIKNNLKVIVISGGYSIYLKYFCQEFNISNLFATEIKFNKNKCTGAIKGLDCLFENKVIILERSNINFNLFENKIVFTDSPTDLPLLNWANIGYVVSRNKNQRWATEKNFKQIIWSK